jgi:hypothetical protein
MERTGRRVKITELSIGGLALSLLGIVYGVAGGNDATSSPPPIGTWSNVQVSQGEDPHASGIEVELWKHNGQLIGFLSEYVGPVADPPVGKLESIRFDEKTGKISFTSKLSVGVVAAAAGNTWVPSKNLYEFNGVIGKNVMTGTLRRIFVQEDQTEPAYEENLTLEPKTTADGDPAAGESFEQWLHRWNEVLKKRGPKW